MTKKPDANLVRATYLRFKLDMLDKWIHQLNVERRYVDREYQKLLLQRRATYRIPNEERKRPVDS